MTNELPQQKSGLDTRNRHQRRHDAAFERGAEQRLKKSIAKANYDKEKENRRLAIQDRHLKAHARAVAREESAKAIKK